MGTYFRVWSSLGQVSTCPSLMGSVSTLGVRCYLSVSMEMGSGILKPVGGRTLLPSIAVINTTSEERAAGTQC